MATSANEATATAAMRFWLIAAAVTLARVAVLVLSEAELGPDEAQYWYWSEHFAFGYFSKPPLIAWAIGFSTSIFGNAEWAVRLPAPLFHFGAAAFIYLLGKRAFGENVGFWAGVTWLALPGVALSSFIMATDSPLLLFWTSALYVLFLLYEKRDQEGAHAILFATLGALVGLGLLAKYAMIYFPIALAITLIIAPEARHAYLRPALALSAVISAALIAPNILWNVEHDFQTFAHTADNANWATSLFHPGKFAEFFGAQFLIFGLIPAVAFVWFLARPARTAFGAPGAAFERLLLAFALTPILIVMAQAFISRAHANWAASGYPAALILVTAWAFRLRRAWIPKASVALNGVAAAAFCAAVINFTIPDQFGLTRAVSDIRGWRDQTDQIAAKAEGFDAIVIDDRYLISEALYYQRNSGFEIVAIDSNQHINSHFEAFLTFDPDRHRRVLFVSILEDDAHVNYRFRNITPLGPAAVAFGGVKRSFEMFDISDYHWPNAPPSTP